ncbi:hypothetical protein SACS_0512 [Parasaccharibacter apium]|uniref:Uncharacterized protein n=1 Tax=Parasaccharibacter apium TaxID=1510841 RepID=A0A7U7G502_9PROT|nr:hypothetical protein SACS_0512 [Parasaccharibacter apium]
MHWAFRDGADEAGQQFWGWRCVGHDDFSVHAVGGEGYLKAP